MKHTVDREFVLNTLGGLVSINSVNPSLAADGPGESASYPLAISSAFGLLHGLGFAAALREMGLPSSEQLTALLAFNLGVEIGQVLFVVSAGLLIWIGHQLPIRVDRWSQFFPKAVGVLASFWFFQRLILGVS